MNHPLRSRRRPLGRALTAGAFALLWPLAAAADLPVLTPEEIACQKATFTSATSYIQRAFAARQDCLLEAMKGNLAPTVDCFARLDDGGTGDLTTDTSLDAAARAVAVDITNPCIGLDFTNLGFPGFCPIVVEGEYTLLDHEVCILTASDDVIETLLGIEYPWPIGLPVANAERSCGDTVGRKSSQMFVNETDTRTRCQTHQLEGTVALAVDCRAEQERLDPATGDTAVDTDILTAHNKVLRETANACTHSDLTDLGFPGECGTPIGSTFTVAALVECMFVTHHDEMIRYIDVLSPSTTECGNNEIDFTEKCDDGDNLWQLGEYCLANCDAITLCGDINGDGRLTATDALFVLQAAVGLQTCTDQLCDANGDGRITATDALVVLQAAVGLPVTLSCPAIPPLGCGNGVIDATVEQCDDGDTSWVTGQFCNGSCLHLRCGDPNDSDKITAQDAQYILLVSTGLRTCDLEVCDVDASGKIVALDALKVLQKGIGLDIALVCPGNVSATEEAGE